MPDVMQYPIPCQADSEPPLHPVAAAAAAFLDGSMTAWGVRREVARERLMIGPAGGHRPGEVGRT